MNGLLTTRVRPINAVGPTVQVGPGTSITFARAAAGDPGPVPLGQHVTVLPMPTWPGVPTPSMAPGELLRVMHRGHRVGRVVLDWSTAARHHPAILQISDTEEALQTCTDRQGGLVVGTVDRARLVIGQYSYSVRRYLRRLDIDLTHQAATVNQEETTIASDEDEYLWLRLVEQWWRLRRNPAGDGLTWQQCFVATCRTAASRPVAGHANLAHAVCAELNDHRGRDGPPIDALTVQRAWNRSFVRLSEELSRGPDLASWVVPALNVPELTRYLEQADSGPNRRRAPSTRKAQRNEPEGPHRG